MKNMFKILFCTLLLQASLLFSQETDVLYQFKTSSGKQWKTFGNAKIQPIYKGETKNGVPNGQGIFTYPDGRKYFGQWKDGELNGHGTYTSPLRWKYEGEFKDSKFHGQGIYIYPDGERYMGQFNNGVQDGKGTLSYPDGRKYVGEFKNGIQNGQGTNTFSNGWYGIGEWIDVEPWNIKVFDNKGDLKMKWTKGEVQYF